MILPGTHADPYVIVNLRGCGRDVLAWPYDRVLKDRFVGSRLIDRYIRTDVNIFWLCNCPTAPLSLSDFIRASLAVSGEYDISDIFFPLVNIHKWRINDKSRLVNLSNEFDVVSIYAESERMTMTVIRMSSSESIFHRAARNSFILCHMTLYVSNAHVRVNSIERADMCEISLIFELGWQWWYKRGACTTRIVPCTGWQISPSRHPCPAPRCLSPCKYIRGWSSHWRRHFRGRAKRFNIIINYYCVIIGRLESKYFFNLNFLLYINIVYKKKIWLFIHDTCHKW